ncbi:MAG: hypothetical protein VB858_07960, partial [Planctomycetaceae bacterium]
GAVELARGATEFTDQLTEDGSRLEHDVFHVFFNAAGNPVLGTFENLVNGTTVPQMVLESARPEYQPVETSPAPVQPGGEVVTGLAALGDLDADGRDDFGLIDPLGSGTHVFFGQDLTPYMPVNSSDIQPVDEYVFAMTTPRLDADPPRTGLDLNESAPHNILDAFRLEGDQNRELLSETQSIGDFNDDGYDDLLVYGDQTAYVLLGPPRLDGIDDVGLRSEIAIDLSGGWRPAVHRGGVGNGDADLDGTDDLFFYRALAGLPFQVSVLPGTTRPQRNYSVSNDGAVVVQLSGMPNGSAHLLNYDGDDYVDLLVADADGVNGGNAGQIFAGQRFEPEMNSQEDLESVLNDNPTPATLNATTAAAVITYTRPSQSQGNALLTSFLGSQASDYNSESGQGTGKLHVAVLDIDARGTDSVLFVNPDEVVFTATGNALDVSVGTAYVFEPLSVPVSGPGTPVELDVDEVLIRTPGLGASSFDTENPITALGDVNRDGFEDFALIRGYEAKTAAEASVLVYYGGANRVPSSLQFPSPPLDGDDADLAIRRFDQDALPDNTLIVSGAIDAGLTDSSLSMTAGDFDNDRRMDLAIGQASSRLAEFRNGSLVSLDQTDQGSVHIVWNAASLGGEVVLDQAPADLNGDGRVDVLRLDGAFDRDGFGSLPATPGIDADRDGYDDLFIGAARADALRASVVDRAGAIYAVYGTPRRIPLPDEALVPVVELANRTFTGIGDVIVDTGTGRPAVFSGLDESGMQFTTDFELPAPTAQQIADGTLPERWYRFTTVGDGSPGVDVLRLLPFAYDERTVTLPPGNEYGTILLPAADFPSVLEFDLSGLLEAYEDADAIDRVTLQLEGQIDQMEAQDIEQVTVSGNRLFFTAHGVSFGDLTGRELWVSDGTAGGTRLVRDIVPGRTDANPEQLTAFGNDVAFVLDDGSGKQIWVSDGSSGGTQQVLAGLDEVGPLTEFNGNLIFAARSGSDWQVFHAAPDGSTDFVITAISNALPNHQVLQLRVLDTSTVFFSVLNTNTDLQELYVSNGTLSGTMLLREFGTVHGQHGQLLDHAAVFDGQLYFSAQDRPGPDDHGHELWRTDGTTTVEFADLVPGGSDSHGAP